MMAIAFTAGSVRAQSTRQAPHDLRSPVVPQVRPDSAMCVFCHAPIGERMSSAQAPRWQPSAGGNGPFAMYAAPMNDAPDSPEIPGASIICLSCHDATQAPGVANGSNDHPIGIPYAGLAGTEAGGVWQASTIDDQSLAHRLRVTGRDPRAARVVGRGGFRPPTRSVIDQRVVWWVATSVDAVRRTRNDLPLYGQLETYTGAVTISAPTVECGTCHDPHNTTPMFLRVPNSGSRLCLSCHDT